MTKSLTEVINMASNLLKSRAVRASSEESEWEPLAPHGKIWICVACGKLSKSLEGEEGTSWDESCMLNAILIDDKTE